ncbi:MAG: TspO/MBR family protein [Candidatus Nealsonbacteria bacterium]
MSKTILTLLISIIIAQLAGAVGSIFTASSIGSWYAFLEKPAFSPSNWLFAPAWITLYALMGIAAFLIWQKRGEAGARSALYFYGGQLILNSLWSVIFFGFQNPFLAFLEIIVLWLLIAFTTVKFYRIEKAAGLLFVPYILWVTFAMVLNFAVWRLNM